MTRTARAFPLDRPQSDTEVVVGQGDPKYLGENHTVFGLIPQQSPFYPTG
jgi:hypothetical protein